MSTNERAKYESQSKAAKQQRDGTAPPGEQYTCHGIAYSVVEKARNDAETADRTMKSDIDTIVRNSYLNNTIADQTYHFIAANYFCKTLTENVYVPAELALVRYSLADGCTRKFHTFVDPGQLPAGYAYDAVERCQTKHGIKPPPSATGERSYAKLMRDLVAFVKPPAVVSRASADGPAKQRGVTAEAIAASVEPLPPLFTDQHQLPVVRSIVQQLCEAAGRDPGTVRVYPLVRLFFVLKREATRYGLDETVGFPSEHVAQAMLDRDQYDHRSEIACELHNELDRAKHCALSIATRYGFILSDHICLDLGIDLKLGQHVPSDSDVTAAQLFKTEMDTKRSQSMMSAARSMAGGSTVAEYADDGANTTVFTQYAEESASKYAPSSSKRSSSDTEDSENDNTKYSALSDLDGLCGFVFCVSCFVAVRVQRMSFLFVLQTTLERIKSSIRPKMRSPAMLGRCASGRNRANPKTSRCKRDRNRTLGGAEDACID